MTLVVVHTHPIRPEQKSRIEEALVAALDKEGFPASRVMLLFQEGILSLPPEDRIGRELTRQAPASEISPEFKTRARRTRAELLALKTQLIEALKANGTLNSLQARKLLGLTNCDWAPSALRRIFGDLEIQGLAIQRGCKRNTCYTWNGPANHTH